MNDVSKVERPKLAGAFSGGGVPDRSSGLSGLLPPSPATTQAAEAEPKESTPVEPEAQPQPSTTRKKATRQEKNIATAALNVGVYLEPELLEATRRAKRGANTEKTYDDLLFEALERVSEEDLRTFFQPEQVESSTSLLPRRSRRQRGAAGIQIQLRLDANQRQTLDSLKTQVGAPSRSALVAAAYRLALLD